MAHSTITNIIILAESVRNVKIIVGKPRYQFLACHRYCTHIIKCRKIQENSNGKGRLHYITSTYLHLIVRKKLFICV